MNKAQLIDLGKKFLGGGGSVPPELRAINDNRVIEKFLSMAFDSLFNSSSTIKDEIGDEMGQYNWKYAQMTKRFLQPILKDDLTGQFYSELPSQIMSINNNQGIVQISPSKEQSTAFLPRKSLGGFLMNNLDVNTLSNIFFNLEGNKVWFEGNINSCWESVLMRLAVKFEELDDDDYVQIPDGDSGKIFDQMLMHMTGKLPSDFVNDDVPQQNTK